MGIVRGFVFDECILSVYRCFLIIFFLQVRVVRQRRSTLAPGAERLNSRWSTSCRLSMERKNFAPKLACRDLERRTCAELVCSATMESRAFLLHWSSRMGLQKIFAPLSVWTSIWRKRSRQNLRKVTYSVFFKSLIERFWERFWYEHFQNIFFERICLKWFSIFYRYQWSAVSSCVSSTFWNTQQQWKPSYYTDLHDYGSHKHSSNHDNFEHYKQSVQRFASSVYLVRHFSVWNLSNLRLGFVSERDQQYSSAGRMFQAGLYLHNYLLIIFVRLLRLWKYVPCTYNDIDSKIIMRLIVIF